jgi:hypothetical protein
VEKSQVQGSPLNRLRTEPERLETKPKASKNQPAERLSWLALTPRRRPQRTDLTDQLNRLIIERLIIETVAIEMVMDSVDTS